MNFKKIKEFISLRAELLECGVIGLSAWDDEVQVRYSTLINETDLQIELRDCDQYPYQAFVIKDGIKIYSLLTKENLEKNFPQFAGYMVEDVNLDGMESADYAS